jgi:phytoene synthase
MPQPTGPAFAFEQAAAQLREHDRDRYYAALFATPGHRRYLFALYAFNSEIARIRNVARDPLPGEVRLQWWRDLFEGEGEGGAGGNPLASALLETIAARHLPRQAFVNLIDAHAADLYDDPVPGWNELEGYCGETSSALVRLASLVLADGADPGGAAEAGHAGVAIAITGLLRALPFHAGQGRVMLPADVLARHGVTPADILAGDDSPGLRAALAECRARARGHLAAMREGARNIRPDILPAFLPGALVEGYLRQMERPDYHPFRSRIERADWLRLAILWRASRQGI